MATKPQKKSFLFIYFTSKQHKTVQFILSNRKVCALQCNLFENLSLIYWLIILLKTISKSYFFYLLQSRAARLQKINPLSLENK